MENFLALAAHAVAGAKKVLLVERVAFQSLDFDVARIDGVLQRVDSGLVELDVMGDLVLLVDAVFTEQQLRCHHRDGDDDSEQG